MFVFIDQFVPASSTREADRTVTDWLKSKAFHPGDVEVWLLVAREAIIAFHTAEIAHCDLPEQEQLRSLHCAKAGRHRDFPGAGARITEHLVELARLANVEIVTVDPFDKATEKPWRSLGFSESRTPVGDDHTAKHPRLWKPVNPGS